MDDSISIEEIRKMNSAISEVASKHCNLHGVDESVYERLLKYMQERANLKPDFIAAFQEELFLTESEKPPEEWFNVKQAEADLLETREIMKEVKSMISDGRSKLQERADIASDALATVKERTDILSRKIEEQDKKFAELFSKDDLLCADDENLKYLHTRLKCLKEMALEDLAAARYKKGLIVKRTARVQETLQHFEEISAAWLKEESVRKNELNLLQAMLKEIETFAGIQCHIRDGMSVDVDFLCNDSLQKICMYEDDDSAALEAAKLTVTLKFCETKPDYLELADVQMNKVVNGAEPLITAAKHDKDLAKLIMELKRLWESHVPLITEITNIRKRHAVDWIQEKGILQLMVKRSSNVVCTLKVPSSYPFSGSISLENVMGQSTDVNLDDITAPSDQSLRGWIQHLENFFSNSV